MNSFAHLNVAVIILLLSSKPSHSQEIDFLTIEENLLNSIRDIRSEVITLQKSLNHVKTSVDTLDARLDFLKRDQDEFQFKTEKTFLKLEEAANNIFLEVSLNKDLIKRNQDAYHSMLEKAQLKLEEKLIKYISEVENDISLSVSSFKESFNATGSLTNLVLEKISSQTEDIKEILNKKEKPFGDDTNSNGTVNLETNKTGMETTCANFNKSLFSIANALFHTNYSSNGHLDKCWLNFYNNINGLSYFRSPLLKGNEFASYCQKHGAEPFFPRTQEEFITYIAAEIINAYFWYPINDMNEEGRLVLHDGTDYENLVYKPEKWDTVYTNQNDRDCVKMDLFGEGSFSECDLSYIKYTGFCQRK